MKTAAEADEAIVNLPSLRKELQDAVDEKDLAKLNDVLSQAGEFDDLEPEIAAAKRIREHLMQVEKLKFTVLCLNRETMLEIRNYEHPPKHVHDVIRALLLVLGDPESITSSWAACRKRANTLHTHDYPGLFRRIHEFDIRDLDPSVVKRAEEILADYTEENIRKLSVGAAAFYSWVKAVCKSCMSSPSDCDISDIPKND